jgi:hypothetical protein
MTWIPIITSAIKTKSTLFPLVILSLSFGSVASIFYGNINREHLERLKSEQEEMRRWSSSLQDPTSPNFQPFTFNNK